jgi:carboxyl-terminal processing protease
VKVTVQRTGGDVKHTYALTRREIHLRSVPRATVLRPGVGYVDLNDFSDSASTEVARAVDSLQKAGATSIVLDLRGNPGGLLPQGVAVAQLFLAAGSKIVSLRGRTPDMTTDVAADTGRKFLSVPLVVLVNGGTASAAEIVAGAVQDADRAVLVGSATYGKGSAQSVFPLGAEALKLTTARWFTPLGRSITRAPLVRPESDDDRSPHDSATKRVAFKTPAGRTVFGGDAISPDVVVADTARSAAERVLERALTGKVITFRDAAAATALGFRREVTSIDITVNDAQRAAFRKALVARRLVLDDSVWAAARPVIDRVLGNELVRSALGADALFQRQVSADVVLQRALEIASGTKVPKDVFARAVPAAAGKRAAD